MFTGGEKGIAVTALGGDVARDAAHIAGRRYDFVNLNELVFGVSILERTISAKPL